MSFKPSRRGPDIVQPRWQALIWRVGVPTFCIVSTAIYIAVSDVVRTDLKSLSYLDSVLRNFPAGYEPLYLLLFVVSCLLTGALISGQLRPWCPPGPTFCLFALAAVVAPPQIVAIIRWPDGRGAIRSEGLLEIAVAINALLAGWVLLSRHTPSKAGNGEPDARRWGWGGIFLATTASLLALVLISASSASFGPDALSYHLPLAASWLKTGSLITGAGVQFQYPESTGLLFRWALASQSDRFVFVVPFFCAALTVYVLYAIGREVGHSREVAAVCACCAAVCPVFLNLSTSAYSETFGCLCALLAVYYLVLWSRAVAQRPWPFPLCIGLAAGMAAGARYQTLPLVSMVLGWSLVLAWIRLRGKWNRLAATTVLALAAFAGGGYWYVRNLARFGNPFYPVAVLGLPGMSMETIGGGSFFTIGMRWATYPWRESPFDNPFEGGLGAAFGALCIPAILLCPFLFWRRSRQGRPVQSQARLVYILVLGSGALHAFMQNIGPRHALGPILLSFVLIGVLWHEVDSRYFRAAACLPFATTVFLTGAWFFTGVVYRSNLPRLEGAERFDLPKAIDEIQPARILNAGPQYYTYGLMGKDYRHEVVSLFGDATPADAAKYHVDYVFVRDSDVPRFQAALKIALMAETKNSLGERFSLWRVIPKGS